jgi:hypothetical protein
MLMFVAEPTDTKTDTVTSNGDSVTGFRRNKHSYSRGVHCHVVCGISVLVVPGLWREGRILVIMWCPWLQQL